MSVAELLAALGALGGLGGLGALASVVRARAQNGLDEASTRKVDAEAESIEVRTARELIAELRAETDRKVTALEREVAFVRGQLEAAVRERDTLRDVERQLRDENRGLRERIEKLEQRIAELTAELATRAAGTTSGA